MKNRLFLRPACLLFAMCLIFGCGEEYEIVVSQPDELVGIWTRTDTINDPIDTLFTSLNFKKSGHFEYTENLLIAGTAQYWENGLWEVQHLDLDKNNIFNISEEHKLKISVRECSKSENIGKENYLDFKVSSIDTIQYLIINLTSRDNLCLEKN